MNKSALSPIEKQVLKHIKDNFGKEESPVLIVGVSGGADSMALLYSLKQLQAEVVVVHINYQKRGEHSEKDQELVEQIALQWNFDCHSVQLEPEKAEGQNFQHWAREQRYNIFRELKHEYDADAIAVAHHQDDQIETILQKLFRGAGLESWGAMSVWDEPLFRPLINIKRREIMDYVEEHAIPYRTDHSNLKSNFARNLLRNEWLDKLGDFFPGWRNNVLRLPEQAEIFSESLEYIEQQVTDNRDRIDVRAYNEMSPGLRKALVLHMLKKIDPSVEVTKGALDQTEDLSSLQTGKAIQLTDHYSLLNDRDQLKIVYEQTESLALIEINRKELQGQPFSFNGLVFSIQKVAEPNYEQALYLDCAKLKWPLTLRQWKAGDAFQPFGMIGHQNVSDHLTNRKVSSAEKGSALVLESFEETICAVIFPPIENMNPPGTISEVVKCDDDTSECLVIKRNA